MLISNCLQSSPIVLIADVLFPFVTIQYTVAGQVGVVGLYAPNPVKLVPKNAPEAVQILVHNMVASLAQGPHSWCDHATNCLAQVSS